MNLNVKYENRTEYIHFSKENSLLNIPHLHKEIEMVFIKEGTATATVNEKTTHAKTGDLIIVFPNQVHCYEKMGEGIFYVIIFPTSILYDITDTMHTKVPDSSILSIEKGSNADKLINAILGLSEQSIPYRNTALAGCINLLMSFVMPRLTLTESNTLGNELIKSVVIYCQQHYTEDLTLDSVASQLCVSKYYISHQLNKYIKLSFNNFINSLRISTACELLIDTDYSITYISESVGFGTIRTFNNAFLKIEKISPRKYRSRHRRG